MSTVESRSYRAAGRPDRLLRAAVTAFCSITRPSRRETAQLDDLAGPLLGAVSDDTLRFVAASLCDTPYAPPVVVRRLADLSPDISAPLLLRSPVLGSIDLVALIGRHGTGHARVIAARDDLDQRISRLVASIDMDQTQAPVIHQDAPETAAAPPPAPETVEPPIMAEETGLAEPVRDRLRAMMRPAGFAGHADEGTVKLRWDGDPGSYRKLRSTALTGVPALFHTALADALHLDLARARAIVEASDVSGLIVALRSLSLSAEEAFLIVQCVWPTRFSHVRAISGFLDAFAAVEAETATRIVAGWASSDPHIGDDLDLPRPAAANEAGTAPRLKAS